MRPPRVLLTPLAMPRLPDEGAGSVPMGWICGTLSTANLLHKC